jgi:hypothetical protein
MLRKARFAVALLLVSSAALQGVTRAADDSDTPLAAIPEDVSVVVRWKTPKASFARTQQLVQQVDAEIGGQMKGFGAFLGLLVSNPALQGIDQQRDWWAAVFPAANADPGIVFIVPVTDADAARQAVIGEFHFVHHGDWLLYTDQQPLAERITAHIAGEGKSVEPLIGREANEVFQSGDLSAFVNVRRLAEIYRANLDQLIEEVESQFSMIENLPVQGTPFAIRSVIGLYRTIFRALIQGVRDSETLTVALNAGERGLSCEELLTVQSESQTAKLFAQHAPSDLALVGRLPADRLAYFGFHGDTQAFTRWAMEFGRSMLPASADAQQAADELVEGYKQLKLGDYAVAFNLADLETGVLRSTTVTEVDKPDAVRDLSRKTVVRMGTIDSAEFKQQVELRSNAEDYGPYQADITTVRQEFAPDNPFGQSQEQAMQMMFGPEGLTTRSVYTKDALVQTLGGGRPTMEAALEALGNQGNAALSGRLAFKTVRERLSPEANVLLVVDVPSLMSDFMRIVSAGGIPIPFSEDDARQLNLKRSYSGLSITTGSTTLRSRLWIPAEQAKGIAKVARAIEELANQPEF